MKSTTTSLRQQIPVALTKVVLVLTCLIGLSILTTGCPSPGSGDNTNNNNNNQNPTLLPLARVSINDDGVQADNHSYLSSMSSDGNLIAYYSLATNLTANDTRANGDIYVFDRKASKIKWVSANGSGTASNGDSWQSMISANGQFVVYTSTASDLVSGDSNSHTDIFLFDMAKGETTRVSVDAAENQVFGESTNPSISADGQVIAFESTADTLVVPDGNGAMEDIYVVDRKANTIERVSVSSPSGIDGSIAQGNGNSFAPAISGNGRFVAFFSDSDNLVKGDANQGTDVFVYDRQTKNTELISMGIGNTGAAGDTFGGNVAKTKPVPAKVSINNDGQFVAFTSDASNLVSGDTNGVRDIFVYDRTNKTMEKASISENSGWQVDADSNMPVISANGRFVAFESTASYLIGGDSNGVSDIFLRDREKKTTQLVSVTSNGQLADKESTDAFISADGHYLSFQSEATNILPNDTNGKFDIFVVPIIPAN